MKNRLLRLLKHDLNHVSIACHNKGVLLNDCLRVAKTLDYNERLVVGMLAEEFGPDEFARIKKTWDSLPPSEDNDD